MPVNYWLNLEAQYQEIKARKVEEAQLHNDLDWLDRVPLKDLIKLGWIEKFKDKNQQLEEVLQFFGIASIRQWADIWPGLNVAFRQYNKHKIFPEAVSAWLRQGERVATTIPCPANELIPRKKFRGFISEADFSRNAIIKFAKEIGIAPGIVVGQLQRKELLGFSQRNDLKCRYKWDHE